MDNAFSAVGHIGHDDIVGLIGCVAEEVTLEGCLGTFQRAVDKAGVGIKYGFQLGGVWQAGRIYVNHHMILLHLCAVIKLEHFSKRILELEGLLFVVHYLFSVI